MLRVVLHVVLHVVLRVVLHGIATQHLATFTSLGEGILLPLSSWFGRHFPKCQHFFAQLVLQCNMVKPKCTRLYESLWPWIQCLMTWQANANGQNILQLPSAATPCTSSYRHMEFQHEERKGFLVFLVLQNSSRHQLFPQDQIHHWFESVLFTIVP